MSAHSPLRPMAPCEHDGCNQAATHRLLHRNLCEWHFDAELTERRLTIMQLMGRL